MAEAGSYVPNEALSPWVGKTCVQISRREYDWSFELGDAGVVYASCPWRILADGGIALADKDDGQKFGLPEPVNGAEEAARLLSGRKIISVEVSPVSGDLKVHFEGDRALEFFNNSSSYEGWQATAARAGQTLSMVAQGGGQIAMWEV